MRQKIRFKIITIIKEVKYYLQRIEIGGDEQTARVLHNMSVKCVCVSLSTIK